MPSLKPSLAAADRAFPSHPRLDRYFAGAVIEAARGRINDCVLRGDGPAMLLGAPGVGKTMLLEVLAADLEPRLSVVRLAGAQLCTRRALLQAILHGLGGPYRNREEGELRIALNELVMDPAQTGAGVALLIDEAQTLPLRLLEELRQLANLAVDGAPRVRLVLAGVHALDEAFTSPELEAFSQRLAARCYLEPLSREETSQYVRAHIAAAGGDPDTVLAADAYEAIQLASDGLPRLINQVVDRALTLASRSGATALDNAAISEAWSDLHQLAAPWQSPSKAPIAAATAEVEYGLLDETPEAQTEYDLQAEAAAVMALGEQAGVGDGDWVAGDKLGELAPVVDEAAPAEGEDEFVSYTFPTVVNDEDVVDEAYEPSSDENPVEEAEEELTLAAETDDVAGVADDEEQAVEEEAAEDPFAESFEEEELLLDPSSERERVIPAAPLVTTLTQTEVNQALTAYQESLSPSVTSPPEMETLIVGDQAAEALQSVESIVSGVEEILVIEEEEGDAAATAPAVHRQDYAELFANLRQG